MLVQKALYPLSYFPYCYYLNILNLKIFIYVCLHEYMPHLCKYLWRSGDDVGSSEAGVTLGIELGSSRRDVNKEVNTCFLFSVVVCV